MRKIIISILGRPNVGKSTLFNRLIKSRKAIIDGTPGVTRDIIRGDMSIDQFEIRLQDTGGLTDEGDILNPMIQKKSLEALHNSDIIMFMVEARTILPVEEEYLKLIRKAGKPTIIVMNKSDSNEKDIFVHDFHKYGLGEPLPISASHNRNIDELLDLLKLKILSLFPQEDTPIIEQSDDSQNNEDETDDVIDTTVVRNPKDIKIAIVGKPNVGKSSLLNKLTGTDRSIVSNIPGTTRDVIDESMEFKDYTLTFLDTAGIRRKAKVFEDIEYYSVNRSIKAIEEADVTLLVIDSLEDISQQDKKITDQIVKNGKGLIVIYNKIDLLTEDQDKQIKEKKSNFDFKFPQINYAPFIATSALDGKGLKTLLQKITSIKHNLDRKISTSELNNFIQDVIRKYSPSSKKGVLRIFYGVQISTSPVEFIFFLNKTSLITDSYKNYMANRLREYFQFDGVPFKIIYKNKSGE